MLHFSRTGVPEVKVKDSLTQSTSLMSLISASKSANAQFSSPSGIREACHRAAGLSSDNLARSVMQKKLLHHARIGNKHKVDSVESEPSHYWSEDDNDLNHKFDLYEDSMRMSDDNSFPDSSYVQFAKKNPDILPPSHEYCYPVLPASSNKTKSSLQKLDTSTGRQLQVDSNSLRRITRQETARSCREALRTDPSSSTTCSTVELSSISMATIPCHNARSKESKNSVCSDKSKKLAYGQRALCVHCREMFTEGISTRCADAPSNARNCIECVSCLCAAHGMLYHCAADSDGQYDTSCDCLSKSQCKKWTILAVLSLCLPCLCLYYPLMGCHKCAVNCGFCIGRHKAMQ